MWSVRWTMKSQSVQLSHYITEVQNDCLNYFFIWRFAIFVRKRELCSSALSSFKDWASFNKTYVWTNSGGLRGKDVASYFSSRLKTETRKFAAPFISDWYFDGYGTVMKQIEQQIENRSDNNCILGTVVICLLDTSSWQEIQLKPPDILRWDMDSWTWDYLCTTPCKKPVKWNGVVWLSKFMGWGNAIHNH